MLKNFGKRGFVGLTLLILVFLIPENNSPRTGRLQNLINLEPDNCFLGGSIKIFGWVKPNYPGTTRVFLEFKKPVSGAKVREKVKTDTRGNYTFLFRDTDEPGRWAVKAWKEGTSSKGEASFEVGYTVFLLNLCQDLEKEKTGAGETFAYFNELLAGYPDFPRKDEILSELGDLLQLFKDYMSTLSPLKSTLTQLGGAMSSSAGLPQAAVQEFIRSAKTCDITAGETQKREGEVKEVLAKSRQETEWCYIWMAYHDLCEQLKFYNNFLATSLKGVAKNLLKAELTEGLDPKVKKLIGKVVNKLTGSRKSPVGLAKKIMGKMAGLGSKVYSHLLQNCQTYSGEVTGQYKTQLLHNNMVFYTMSYNLTGKIELTFQKRQPGDPAVYLKGRFKGRAKDFNCLITMVPYAQPDTIGPVYCLGVTPLVSRRSFLLYLEGKALDDQLELKLDKSERDFKLKSRAFYIMLSSTAYNLPIPGDFSFPLQNAEWFLTRATKISSPEIEYFYLPIDAGGDIPRVNKEFKRTIDLPETRKRVGVRVQLKLKFELCSPKCK